VKDEILKSAYRTWSRRNLTWTVHDEKGVEEGNEVDLGKREENAQVEEGKRQG
jgi:hypothetical protein